MKPLPLKCVHNELHPILPKDQFDVRLSGNSISPGQGYVEIYFNGAWGTICRQGWGFLDAFVVCRQLGFSWVSYRGWEGDYGPDPAGPVWLNDVQCLGSEKSLDKCANDGWKDHNCTSGRTAAVSCGFIGKIPLGWVHGSPGGT